MWRRYHVLRVVRTPRMYLKYSGRPGMCPHTLVVSLPSPCYPLSTPFPPTFYPFSFHFLSIFFPFSILLTLFFIIMLHLNLVTILFVLLVPAWSAPVGERPALLSRAVDKDSTPVCGQPFRDTLVRGRCPLTSVYTLTAPGTVTKQTLTQVRSPFAV